MEYVQNLTLFGTSFTLVKTASKITNYGIFDLKNI